MEKLFSCVVYGPPIGKGRPRMTQTGHVYTPKKTADWEAMAVAAARDQKGDAVWPLKGPLRLTITAYFGLPKGDIPKRYGGSASNKLEDKRGYYTKKPDGDNVCKCTSDFLVKAGVVRDDVEFSVWEYTALTCLFSVDDPPRVEVVITALDNP